MSGLQLYPAIDLRGGRCVRLYQGRFDAEIVYDDDPVAVARRFEAAGATWLHVVDLDAARRQGDNRELVAGITEAVDVRVQVGGGVRDASLLEIGVARVVIGSAAVDDPSLVRRLAAAHPGAIAVGLDHRDGEVRVRGWEQATGRSVSELATELADAGVAAFVVTDIGRDATMIGPDLDGLTKLVAAVPVPVIASGGVGSLEHLRALRDAGLDGVIVGKALYEGRFTLEEALAACSR